MFSLRKVALVATTLFASATAYAQDAGTSQSGEFRFSIYQPGTGGAEDLKLTDNVDIPIYFNRARCECDSRIHIRVEPNLGNTTAMQNLNRALSANGTDGIGRLYVSDQGADCRTPLGNTAKLTCSNLLSPVDASGAVMNDSAFFRLSDFVLAGFWNTKALFPEGISIKRLFGASGCGNITTSRQLVFIYAADDNITQASTITFTLSLDPTPPSPPSGVKAEGGNNALKVSWAKASATSDTSLRGFMVFCRSADDGLPPFEVDTGEKLCTMLSLPSCYLSRLLECKAGTGDPLADFDLRYRCSGLIPSTSRETTIRGLTNNKKYEVLVASIDKSGNIISSGETTLGEPIATEDFFTDYKDRGGQADGRFCAFGSGRGFGGLAAVGFIVIAVALGWRTRRKGPTLLAIVVVSKIFVGTADAQAVYREDEFNMAKGNGPWQGSPRNYAIELRWGPYRPDVDSEFPQTEVGPYEQSFGTKKRAMWQLEFDWEVFKGFGTLALGAQAGYFKVSGKACVKDKVAADGTCEKSGDSTTLSLNPFTALVVYRFDEIADHLGIPIVPYAKLGLTYIIWSAKDDAGSVVKTTDGTKGSGATTGYQYTLGFSLRLDFLDPSAARAFDGDMGVNHTYAFFELTTVKARGLGSGKSLHLGDSTWFGGLMFEF